jgi:Skp family chaperone for outer membrane proteins
VKSLLQNAAATVALLSLVGTSAQAQSPHSANAQKHGIAVVDMSYVFKNHKRHQAAVEQIKAEMTATEGELKADSEKIRQMEEQRNTFNPGAPEYKQIDEELARNIAEFKLKMDRLRKGFMEREAKAYYDAYLEINGSVMQYATSNNIVLVLRYNGDKPDPNRREDVLREINKSVVFQNRIDITPDVLALLNGGGQAPQMGRQPGSQIPR